MTMPFADTLTLLGVPQASQSHQPDPFVIPSGLNQRAEDIWSQAVIDAVTKSLSAEQEWRATIKRFIRRCLRGGINPFSVENHNGVLVKYLMWARRKVVKYIDGWQLLAKYPPLRNSERLVLQVDDKGLTVRSEITLRMIDLWAIKQDMARRQFYRFQGPHGRGKVDWRHRIPGYPIQIGFSSASNFEGILWYEIRMPVRPTVRVTGIDLLMDHNQRVEDYIKNMLWAPVTRVIRMNTLSRQRISTF